MRCPPKYVSDDFLYLATNAIFQLLVENIDIIQVHDVVAQLKEHPRLQYQYLELLSNNDAHAGRDFGKLQVSYSPPVVITSISYWMAGLLYLRPAAMQ